MQALDSATTSPVTTSPEPPQPEPPEFTQEEAFILDEDDEVLDDALLDIDAALFDVGSCDVQIGTEKDVSPSDPSDFIYTDLGPDFKIDSRNLHAGRGLRYPTDEFLAWGLMIERIRKSELTLESQLFLGGSAI